jgi:hypothetical protein
MIAAFVERAKEGIMQQQSWRDMVWLALFSALLVGMLVSLTACAPGSATGINSGANPSPQGTVTATVPAIPTCLAGQSDQPCTPQPASRGTLSGLVVAGPTCPVESVENPCPPRPVPNRLVLIETTGGTVVSRATTDQQGQFTVTLSPGTYQVKVPPDGNPFPVQRVAQQVTVIAGQTVQVKIELDTGIR